MDFDLTIVDLETTGFGPNDRVIEVAMVRLSPGGEIVDSFETLVNPERDVGATQVHGITPSMVSAAPTFIEVSGSVAERIEGTVLVAHNLPFDSRMLGIEFDRLGVPLYAGSGLCTLQATRARLEVACSDYGIDHPGAHRAFEDALVTAQLLVKLLGGEQFGRLDSVAPVRLGGSVPAGKPMTLTRELVGGGEMLSPLVEIARAAQLPSTREGGLAYAESLDRALLDARISSDEARYLEGLARDLGLSDTDLDAIHRSYFELIVQAAERDDVITEQEHGLLKTVAAALQLEDVVIPEPNDSPAVAPAIMPGMHVCFTGTAVDDAGREIPRSRLELIAHENGLVCEGSVTKKRCNLLVAADSASSSGKARKARSYEIPVISVKDFLDQVQSL